MRLLALKKLDHCGDTIIEVLLSTVVISIVLAGAYTISNRATRINQSAIERTTVANLMREQIELIRAAQQSSQQAVWDEIKGRSTSTPPDYSAVDCGLVSSASGFFVEPSIVAPATAIDFGDSAIVKSFNPGPPVVDAHSSDIYSIWAVAYKPDPLGTYVDVHVRACWQGIGGDVDQFSALVLRLNE